MYTMYSVSLDVISAFLCSCCDVKDVIADTIAGVYKKVRKIDNK